MGSEVKVEDRKWRYTWEAQSHIPTLRLLLFPISKTLNLSLHYQNLTVALHSSLSFLTLTSSTTSLSLRVPLPTVLLDADSPPTVKVLADHVEVKLLLLLPVDHSVLSSLHSPQSSPLLQPLVMENDVAKCSSVGKVDFYCRSCGFMLTKNPLRSFVEMPSANWREVADNWFGACCCSFGGISEKLVTRYVNAHTCTPGMCLLSSTSATVCKDDLVECDFPEVCQHQDGSYVTDDNPGGDGVDQGTENFGLNGERTLTCSDTDEVNCAFVENSRNMHPEENGKLSVDIGLNEERNSSGSNAGEVNCAFDENSLNPHHENGKLSVNFINEIAQCDDFPGTHPVSNDATKDLTNIPNCCAHSASSSREEDNKLLFGTARKTETVEILGNQKSFLNGFLEDIFMARSSNLSKDIEWHEFTCPYCTGLLGAYPCSEGSAPVDGGVRLYKCYISTCLPVLGSEDIFSKYTVDKMFANQLMECANDESSFRFVIRDLTTKSPVLQMILLNQDTWSCSGNCSSTEDKDPVPQLQLRPVLKVLFSDCEDATESQLRMVEKWATKTSAESIFMLICQILDLVDSLMSAKDIYPPFFASVEGLILSSVER